MKKRVIRISSFVLTFILLFILIQNVLTPDHNSGGNGNLWYTFNSFRKAEKDSIDVFFLGHSQVLLGISPMKLYEDTGICSYDFGTAAQPVEVSYEICRLALAKQSPSVVFLNAGNLFYDNTTPRAESWRLVMDNLPLDAEKIAMAKDFAEQLGSDGFWAAIFPIIKFHSRWDSLNQDDFRRRHVDQLYTAGQSVVTTVIPSGVTEEGMNAVARDMELKNTAQVKYIKNGVRGGYCKEKQLYQPVISDANMEYLRKMRQICQQAGAELVLFGMPNCVFPMQNNSAWTEELSDKARAAAEEVGIKYFDTAYDVDAGIDFTADTYDSGVHLNLFGAEKITKCIEQYLQDNFALVSNRNDTWDRMLDKYRQARELAYFQNESDLSNYIDMLVSREHECSILIAASTEFRLGLQEKDFTLLGKLGLEMIREGGYANSYIAVIQGGEVEYEAVSNREMRYDTTLDEDIRASIYSADFYSGAAASVVIDGVEYARNQPGLNIVVWDQETGLVLDSASVNTNVADAPVVHTWGYGYFTDYEAAKFLES